MYATWLRDQRHPVRLVDPVPRHVNSPRAKGIEAVSGDARHLAEPDGSRDVVLLYHMLDRAERVQALTEARRVTRDLVIAAVISRWSPLFEGMLRGFVDSPGFFRCSVRTSPPADRAGTGDPRCDRAPACRGA